MNQKRKYVKNYLAEVKRSIKRKRKNEGGSLYSKHHRALRSSPVMRLQKHLLHGEVVGDNSPQHSNMPDVVACAKVVEASWHPALGDLTRVNDSTRKIHKHTLRDGSVEVRRPLEAVLPDELARGQEACHGEGHVEQDAHPGEVFAVEGRVPGEIDAADAEDGGKSHVGHLRDGLAVERCVFDRHDGGTDEQRDTRVVDAGVAGEQAAVGNAVHRVHGAGADEAFDSGEEEERCDEEVGRGGRGEADGLRVEVECDAEHEEDTQEMRPDVAGFIVDVHDGAYAFPVAVAEAVTLVDVRVHLPGFWEVLEADEAVFLCASECGFDLEVDFQVEIDGGLELHLNGLAHAMGFHEAGFYDFLWALEDVVHGVETCVADSVGAGF